MDRKASGTLYVVSMPVGNRDDISVRALETLRTADLILAEDSRYSKKVLQDYGITTPVQTVQSRRNGIPEFDPIERLAGGEQIAFICDVGTPLVADPGLSIVQRVIAAGFRVTAVPGASAVLSALALSGFSATPFLFAGFPPRTKTDRVQFFEMLSEQAATTVIFESRANLADTMVRLIRALGEARHAAIMSNLTTAGELVLRGSLEELHAHLSGLSRKAEFVIVVCACKKCRVINKN